MHKYNNLICREGGGLRGGRIIPYDYEAYFSNPDRFMMVACRTILRSETEADGEVGGSGPEGCGADTGSYAE